MTDAIFGTDGIRGRAYEGWLGLVATAAPPAPTSSARSPPACVRRAWSP